MSTQPGTTPAPAESAQAQLVDLFYAICGDPDDHSVAERADQVLAELDDVFNTR